MNDPAPDQDVPTDEELKAEFTEEAVEEHDPFQDVNHVKELRERIDRLADRVQIERIEFSLDDGYHYRWSRGGELQRRTSPYTDWSYIHPKRQEPLQVLLDARIVLVAEERLRERELGTPGGEHLAPQEAWPVESVERHVKSPESP